MFAIGDVAYSVVCDRTGGLEASAPIPPFNLVAFTSALLFLPTSAGASGLPGLVALVVSDTVLVVV